MDHIDHLLRNGHVDICVSAHLQDRQTTLDALAGLLGRRNRLIDGQPLAEVLTEGAVA